MSSFEKYKQGQETVIFILYLTMCSSICIFFALVEMELLGSTNEPGSGLPMHLMGVLPAIASLFVHYKLKSPQALAQSTLGQARNNTETVPEYSENENRMRFFYPNYFIRMVISLALNESVTILALVGVIIGGTTLIEFYFSFAVSIVLMGLMKPKTDVLFREVEKLLARERY